MDRPILFKGEMVCAILDRRKTQTRRVIPTKLMQCLSPEDEPEKFIEWCRYGKPGDSLWVRETAKLRSVNRNRTGYIDGFDIHYAADDRIIDYPGRENHKPYNFQHFSPSIFMPRWASRITLEILKIRVERLQDISNEDAIAEGITGYSSPYSEVGPSPRDCYGELWAQINGWESWNANPWVWAITFRQVQNG